SSLAATSRRTAARWGQASAGMAFFFGGFDSVTVTTPRSRSTCTKPIGGTILRSDGPEPVPTAPPLVRRPRRDGRCAHRDRRAGRLGPAGLAHADVLGRPGLAVADVLGRPGLAVGDL